MTGLRGVFGAVAALCLSAPLVRAAETILPQSVCAVEAPGGHWSGAAQMIAGLSDSAFASALTPDQHAAWDDFSKHSNSDWAKLSKQYLDHIEAWRSQNLPSAPSRLAFYPFGGPDAINLLAFVPNAREYIMVGLEPVGCVPSTIDGYTPAYFAALRRSLTDVVALGFFITENMHRDVTRTDLNGVLPLLLFLISRAGNSIDAVTPIGISSSGVVAPLASLREPETYGIAIQFSDARHGSRTLRYFSLNLANYGLQKNPGSAKYLKDLPQSVTLLKAASYLMYRPNFADIRSLILSKSGAVIQEDSGIPYHFFDPAGWNVRLYGAYTEPIPLFKKWTQDDLKGVYATGTGVQPLDFGLGYQRKGLANLMLAVRKAK